MKLEKQKQGYGSYGSHQYRIEISGPARHDLDDWFDGTVMKPEESDKTILIHFFDQSALLGILTRLIGLGFVLISVSRIQIEQKKAKNLPLKEKS